MLNTSANIKEPGLNVLPPGVERYTVNGGGLTGIQVFPDDEIEIVNDEGCLLYTSPSPRDRTRSRMPSSA